MHDLSGFERDILYVVNDNSGATGAELKEKLSKHRSAHDNQVYPSLNSLESAGLVRVTEEDGRTNNYTITPRGRVEIERRQEWLEGKEPPEGFEPAPVDGWSRPDQDSPEE